MSLINDALKRAEADKSGHAQIRRGTHPLTADNRNIPRLRTWPAVTIAGLLLTGVTVWAGWSFFYPLADSDNYPFGPNRTKAAFEAKKPDLQLFRAPEIPANNLSVQKQNRSSPRKTAAFAGKLLQRFAGALVAMPEPAKPSSIVATIPASQPDANATAEPSTQPAQTNPLTRFRLTGVIRGPAGVSAVINNRIVEPGQTIDGAKLISADRSSVTLEIDGKLHRLHLWHL